MPLTLAEYQQNLADICNGSAPLHQACIFLQHTAISSPDVKCIIYPTMCGFLPLRANGGVSLHPVFSHPGDAAGLPPQLRRPHPGHHRGDHRGGRQGLPDVRKSLTLGQERTKSLRSCFFGRPQTNRERFVFQDRGRGRE